MRRPAIFLLLATLLPLPASAVVLVVGAPEFHNADGSGHTLAEFAGWIQKGGGSGDLVAPVELPRGAVLKSMSAWIGDSEASGDFKIQLLAKRRGNSVPAEQVARVFSTGIDPAGQQYVIDMKLFGRIVSDQYVYYLSTADDVLDSTVQRIYSVQIEYTLALFADGFESGDTSAWGATPPTYLSKWISGASFSSGAKDYSWPWVFNAALGTFSLPNSTDSTPPCGVAPLELPHGATVLGFLANLYDNRSDRGITLRLRRSAINSLVVSSEMAVASTSGSSGWQSRSDLSVTDPVIDNDNFWYYFELCMTGGTTVAANELAAQAVQVFYSAP